MNQPQSRQDAEGLPPAGCNNCPTSKTYPMDRRCLDCPRRATAPSPDVAEGDVYRSRNVGPQAGEPLCDGFEDAPPRPAPDAMRTSPIGQADVEALGHLADSMDFGRTHDMLRRVIAATPYLSAPVPPADGALLPDGVLPCDVHLPPNTFFRKGVSFDAFMAGLRARYSFPPESKVFAPPAGAAEPDLARNALADKIRYLHGRGLLAYHGDYSITDDEYNLLINTLRRALPPVRADREAIARAIYDLNPSMSSTQFSGPEPTSWCYDTHQKRLAYKQADAILSLPVQYGAGDK